MHQNKDSSLDDHGGGVNEITEISTPSLLKYFANLEILIEPIACSG